MSPAVRRAQFWLHGPLLPMVRSQALRLRRAAPRLPEAKGPRELSLEPEPGQRTLSITVLGESTVAGVGVEEMSEALPFHLARQLHAAHGLGVRLQVVGKNGATIVMTRRDLLPEVRFPVDVVLVAVGMNDTILLTRGEPWEREIRGLVAELRERGARQVVFSPLPRGEELRLLPWPTRSALSARAEYLDERVQRACRREGARYIPASARARPEMLSADGFHPSAEGYARWAERLVAGWPW